MSLFLENGGWMGLLGLALVPLLVHLLARTRPPRFAFSSVEFLRRGLRRSARVRKPQDMLAWLLRTLAVLGVAGAVIGPILASRDAALPGMARSVVVVADRSGSMAAPDGVGTRFSAACEAAASHLKKARPEAANVVWLDSRPEAVFPRPGPNVSFLVESINRAEVRLEAGAVDTAMRIAGEQLAEAPGHRELVLISDFQASAWEDAALPVPDGVKVIKRQVGTETGNSSIEALFVTPADPVAGQEVGVVARVRNHAGTPRRATLYLEAGGGRQSRVIELPAWGSTEAVFEARFGRAEEVLLSAALEADEFPADDRRHAVVEVREALDLVVIGEGGDGEVWNALGDALPWLRVRIEDAPPRPGTAQFAYAADWNGENVERWRELAASGAAVLMRPGPRTPLAALLDLAGVESEGGGSFAVEGSETGWEAEIGDADAKVFALFRTGEFGNPLGGVFRSRSKLPAGAVAGGGRLLARYADGTPAMVVWDRPPAKVVYWGLALDREVSTWPDQSSFVPFIGEFLLHERAVVPPASTEVRAGGELFWQPGEEAVRSQVRLVTSGGEECPVDAEAGEAGTLFRGRMRAAPGVYEWKLGGQLATRRVVNFPETESDLRVMDPGRLAGEEVEGSALLQRAALGRGVPLWPLLAAAALVFLLGEGVVTLWKPRAMDESA